MHLSNKIKDRSADVYKVIRDDIIRDSVKNKWISSNTGFSRGSYSNYPYERKYSKLIYLVYFTEKKVTIANKSSAIKPLQLQ